ncbi:MAG: gene transfer agent family protein [Alphaproteobacteria bacterium]|nr:MAG: gene transfer agent family protein [Alphaproteobacteria bacterium]
MANPWRGEVEITLDGERRVMRLTLGALAELEERLGGDVVALVERFEQGRVSARDVAALILAGLRGGGWAGDAAALARADIAGGFPAAARAAARLLVLAFAGPEAGRQDAPGDG